MKSLELQTARVAKLLPAQFSYLSSRGTEQSAQKGEIRAREGKVPARVVDVYSPAEADFFFSAVIADTLECKIFFFFFEK